MCVARLSRIRFGEESGTKPKPRGADTYLVNYILHDWDNEKSKGARRSIGTCRSQADSRSRASSRLAANSPCLKTLRSDGTREARPSRRRIGVGCADDTSRRCQQSAVRRPARRRSGDHAQWPQFRGPGATGVAADPALPDTWSATENVVWKTAIPGVGWSSPIVWGNTIFLTSVDQRAGAARPPKPGLYFGGERPAPTDEHRWMVVRPSTSRAARCCGSARRIAVRRRSRAI